MGNELGRRRASVSPARFFRSPFFALRPNELNVWKRLLPGVSLQMEQSDVTARAPQEHITRLIYTTPEELNMKISGQTFRSDLLELKSNTNPKLPLIVFKFFRRSVNRIPVASFFTSSSPLHLRRLKWGQLEEIFMKK